MIRYGSLFAGIGGIDLGFRRAGMECIWQVEIDDYCRRVLEKNFPEVKHRYGDIKEIDWEEVERECGAVDVICGGFPCQPHSLAGKRKASEDERDLWGEFARCFRSLRPRWVVVENVPGILSSEAGRFFGRVLKDLAGCGYDAEWEGIPAAAFGAPHIRERVFVVAYAEGQRWEWDGSARGRGDGFEDCGNDVSDTQGGGEEQLSIRSWGSRKAEADSVRNSKDVLDASGEGAEDGDGGAGGFFGGVHAIERQGWWSVEPEVGRVADGVPRRVDRLRGLGNAVVPQVAEWIGKRIMEVDDG